MMSHAPHHLASPSILDRIGMLLSFLCAVHCLVLPFFMISLPIMARYYLAHPWFHLGLALVIVPVGLVSFWLGFRHHQKRFILSTGILGLMLVGVAPAVLQSPSFVSYARFEPWFIGFGSILLVWSHWKNRRACACSVKH
jgi:hypothetical protein